MKSSPFLAAAALTSVITVPAFAADLPSRTVTPVAPMASVPLAYNWTACYVGINGGGLWVDKKLTAASPSDWTFGPFRGLGLAGFQRLRVLFGANTVVPSKEIVAFVSTAVGRPMDAPEAVYLLERAAARLRYDLRAGQREVWIVKT